MISHFHIGKHKRMQADATRPVVTNPIGGRNPEGKGRPEQNISVPRGHRAPRTLGVESGEGVGI